jgi:hypothetical protein
MSVDGIAVIVIAAGLLYIIYVAIKREMRTWPP